MYPEPEIREGDWAIIIGPPGSQYIGQRIVVEKIFSHHLYGSTAEFSLGGGTWLLDCRYLRADPPDKVKEGTEGDYYTSDSGFRTSDKNWSKGLDLV